MSSLALTRRTTSSVGVLPPTAAEESSIARLRAATVASSPGHGVTYMLPMAMLELVVYQDAQGRQPFEAWFEHLDIHAARKITAALQRMTQGILPMASP